jgi:hypothetical protein
VRAVLNTTSTTTNFVELVRFCDRNRGKKLEKLGFDFATRHSELYLVLKTHHEQFMEDEKLKQLFHTYDTNLVEGFNF